MHDASRREFLGTIGGSMWVAALTPALSPLLIAPRSGRGGRATDDLEELVLRMQQTPADELQPQLIERLRGGTSLATLITAGALANARTFGGQDYEGYHAMMALLPAWQMAQQMPAGERPLPVLKVLYRNTARIQTAGQGRQVLGPIVAQDGAAAPDAIGLRALVRERDLDGAERAFAAMSADDLDRCYEQLQPLLRDDLNVHRIVLAWRAWSMLDVTGRDHAHTLLRQWVRFCVDEERHRFDGGRPAPLVREVVPELLERHQLLERPLGTKTLSDAELEVLTAAVFGDSQEHAADAVAKALADGVAPEAVGEAISLAANQLIMHDPGNPNRRGGVHGASVGVHASDAANAWRNVARICKGPDCLANLVVAAYHTAGQSNAVKPQAIEFEADGLDGKSPADLLGATKAAIESRDQAAACAAVARYGADDLPAAPLFALLRDYALSEDGALHAEKYYRTVSEEFERTRPAYRWRFLVALARVTASAYGEPAPGQIDARNQLGA